MKSVIKKALMTILCASFVLIFCVSCGDGDKKEGGNTSETSGSSGDNVQSAGETEENAGNAVFKDSVPQFDFDGYDYRVLVGTYSRTNQELYPEEENGDILNDTIYNRNKKIEERFNVNLKATTISLFDLLTSIRKNVKAGADSYDMYMQIDRDAYTAAAENLLYPVDKLPYIDLPQPYWCQLPNKQLTVGNRLYWGFSDDMLSFFEATIVTYFNKKQAADLGLDDMYNLVRTGNWTQDKFFEYAKSAVKDLDGDGKMTETDNWGIVSDSDYIYYSFWSGAGMTTVDKNDGDIPYFSVPDNPKLFDIAEKVISELQSLKGLALDSSKVSLDAYGGSADNTGARISFFRSGHGLFSIGAIPEMVVLRDMPDDFGILPLPKYTADQTQYYSRVIGGFPYVIPSTNTNTEIAGAIMESMACEARNMIIPAYYESALKNKYSRDVDTAEMLDLIFDTRMYDLGDTIWCMTIRVDYTNIFAKGDNTFMSATEKNTDKYNKAISKLADGILNLE